VLVRWDRNVLNILRSGTAGGHVSELASNELNDIDE
jgi:hypothetical protein